VVVAPTPAQLEDRRQPTTTLEGWRRFVDADQASFDLLPSADRDALTDADRIGYDEARIAYHAELIVVTTSTIRQILHQGRLLTLLNQREVGARRGLIVSGPAATGKTTAVKQLGRTHELRTRQRHPAGDRIPVVYVTAPPKGSPRKLAVEFARFLGLPPIRPRHNVADITDAVCQVLTDARTDLVIVDEIHNLNLATSAGEDLSDHLKYFTEHLPATFVYAGINVERAGLFTGTRGRQIVGRAALVRTGPFPYQQEWKGLVATLERTLRLHRHQPDTLVGLDRYLHQRTSGMIGSLSHLVRAGAISAILDGSEQLTKHLLDGVKVDHAAESATRRASSSAVWHAGPLGAAAAAASDPAPAVPQRNGLLLHAAARDRQPPALPHPRRAPARPR
jgi:Bacterial TniB protein